MKDKKEIKITFDQKVLRAMKTAEAIEWMGRGYCLHESNKVNKIPAWELKKRVLRYKQGR